MQKTHFAAVLASYCRTHGLPAPAPECRFHPARRWAFDFAWPAARVALELEGAAFTAGRHTRGKGFSDDCVKYTEAALLGWKVLRCTWPQVEAGLVWAYLDRAFAFASDPPGPPHTPAGPPDAPAAPR